MTFDNLWWCEFSVTYAVLVGGESNSFLFVFFLQLRKSERGECERRLYVLCPVVQITDKNIPFEDTVVFHMLRKRMYCFSGLLRLGQ